MRTGGLAAIAMTLVLLSIGGPGLPVLVHALGGETEHVCACSLEAGHQCRCPHCAREAHEKFLDELADGRPRFTAHDCTDESGARPSRLPRVIVLDTPLERALSTIAEVSDFAEPAILLSRLVPPPPSPPPIG